MMVDSDGPRLHSPATATKSVQVPDRENIATTPATPPQWQQVVKTKRSLTDQLTDTGLVEPGEVSTIAI